MAKFRNVTSEARFVFYGFNGPQMVEPGGVLEVPDEFVENYDQPGIFEPENKQGTPAASSAEKEG